MNDYSKDPPAVPKLDRPPAGYFLVVPPADHEEADDAIDLLKLASIARQHWKLLACTGLICGLIAAGISLWMRNVYRAEAIISPTQENQNGGSALKSDIGGIAELAGVDLGNEGSRKVEALATLKSKGFVREFILANNLQPILYANLWDANAKTWKKGVTPPTMEQMVKRFMGRRTIDDSTKTGIVTLDFDWYTPELAAQWTNAMIDMVNERMRGADIKTAESSLEYLDKELANANRVELRLAVAHLIESQENNKMMANVQRDYAYHFIDRAVPPQSKHGPLRSLITLGGVVIGVLLGSAYIALRRRAARIVRMGGGQTV
jgi:uncharacterized protein involved in exopolysaccharide biosynthesis